MSNSIGERVQNQYKMAYQLKTKQLTLDDIPADSKDTVARFVQELSLDELQVGGWGFKTALT